MEEKTIEQLCDSMIEKLDKVAEMFEEIPWLMRQITDDYEK